MGKGTAAATLGKIEAQRGIKLAIEMRSPVHEHLKGYAISNRAFGGWVPEVVQPGSHAGKTVAICGAGPSLRTAVIGDEVDDVVGCNSALTYLADAGRRVTAGACVDQTEVMLRDWANPPDVPLYVASTCNPALISHLARLGRRMVFFHNYVGWADGTVKPEDVYADEFGYLCREWPPTFMVGQGATVLSRFISVAEWMGYERIDVYGADCCFGPNDEAHANGERATEAYHNPLIMEGKEYGRTFRTRPDMLMDAVFLARRVQNARGRIRLMGDTLPVALLGKPDEYLDAVCRRLAPGERHPDLQII